MDVRIELDPSSAVYTNLDFITGKVVLSLDKPKSVSAIIVKLEGESNSVLPRSLPFPDQQNGHSSHREQIEPLAMENHKILYRISQLFPVHHGSVANAGPAYNLEARLHTYPFRFQIPLNNSCKYPETQIGLKGFGLGGLQQLQYQHVEKTLPPSLTGYPGMIEIKYYIKATVHRPLLSIPFMYGENRRSVVGFNFMPIEPPREAEPLLNNEVFARRPYVFQAGLSSYANEPGLFKKNSIPLSDSAPAGEVDCRLPNPPILTCNKPLPLRIIFRKTKHSAQHVFLMSIQVKLVDIMTVRARDLVAKKQNDAGVPINLEGLCMPVISPEHAVGTEILIDSRMWDQIPLLHNVAPSFNTCNISRRYILGVRVGLGYGHPQQIEPQNILLPLEFNVEVYSGIPPPAALLAALARRSTVSLRPPRLPGREAQAKPSRDSAYPPHVNAPGAQHLDEAPPSYEQAMAEDAADITHANGARPDCSGVTDEETHETDDGTSPKYSTQAQIVNASSVSFSDNKSAFGGG